jgi:gliding motility-associated-like protein
VANFNPTTSPLCEKQPVTFSDQSTSTEGSITQRIWDFGYPSSGVTRTVPNPFTHTLPGYGQYTVSLTVKTSDGCNSAPFTRTIEALPLARPAFSFPAVSCLPNANIQFTNTSSVPNAASSTLSYLWDFGDPASGAVNTSPQKDPVHTYANLGPFDVKLQVTTDAGCIHDTTIVLNTIHPEPIASFTADLTDVCLGGAVQLVNTSDTKDGTLKSLHWDLDDGSTNDKQSFSHTYRNTGNYNVSLYIINSYDCKSTIATKSVSINPIPVADAGPYRVVLEGGNITINANASNATGMTYRWSPSAGLNDPTLLRPVASPANDTRYLLTVTSDKGCVDTSSMFLKVLFKPLIPNTFTPNGDGVNDRWDIMYLDSYPGAIVEVYNTAGTLLFRSVNYLTPWDGTYKGSRLPFGTYYYVVDPKNGRAKVSGYVTIL